MPLFAVGVHSVLKLRVCRECEVAIPSPRAHAHHVRSSHGLDVGSLLDESVEATEELLELTHGPAEDPDTLTERYRQAHKTLHVWAPVAGIKLEKGFACGEEGCMYLCTDPKSLKAHVKDTHGEHALVRLSSIGKISLQSLFSGRSRHLFRVSGASPIGGVLVPSCHEDGECRGDVDDVNKVVSAGDVGVTDGRSAGPQIATNEDLDESCVMSLLTSASNQARDVDQGGDSAERNAFLALYPFDEMLAEMGIPKAEAAGASRDENLFREPAARRRVYGDIMTYLVRVKKHSRNIAPALLCEFNLRHNDGQFQVRNSQDSLRRTAAVVIQCLECVSRLSSLKVQLVDEELREAVEAYVESVNSSVDRMQLPESSEELSEETRVTHLHYILGMIFVQKLRMCESPQRFFIVKFIACCTVIYEKRCTSMGAWSSLRMAEASDMTPILGALQYITSCCAITEARRMTGIHADVSEEEQDAVVQHVKECMSLSLNTAAGFIRKTLDAASGIAKKDEVDSRYDDCMMHDRCGIVDGIHIGMKHLGSMVKTWHDQIDDLICKKLLFGVTLPDGLRTRITALQDNVSEKRVDYSFLSHEAQVDWVRDNYRWLLTSLKSNAIAAAELFPVLEPGTKEGGAAGSAAADRSTVSVGGLKMRRIGVQKYLSGLQDLQEYLLVCLHLSSGSPARAPEIARLHVVNSREARRNVFIDQSGGVMVVSRYNKTRTMKRGDTVVARFPDRGTAERLLVYLTLFRTLECDMVRALHGNSAMVSHWQHLFCRNGEKWRDAEVRSLVSTLVRQGGITGIGFSHLRHFAAGMVRRVISNVCQEWRTEIEDEYHKVGHEQAGHSAKTGELVYGRRQGDLPHVEGRKIPRYRQWSGDLHRFMGLIPASNNDLNSFSVIDIEVTKGKRRRSEEPEKVQQEEEEEEKEEVDDDDDDLPVSAQKRRKVVTKASDPATLLPTAASPGMSNVSSWGANVRLAPLRDSDKDLRFYLPKLREMLHDDGAFFKSTEQLSTVADVHEGRESVIAVMPTGAGKTLCALLPIFMEGARSCSIMLVPLRALVRQHVETCKRMGVRAVGWAERDELAVQLYVFSCEYADRPEFECLARRLQNEGRLKRIIVDEAHLTGLWTFRKSLRQVKYACKTLPQQVPRLLLSATIRPEEYTSTAVLHGMNSAIVRAMPTVRKNLSLRVHEVSRDQGRECVSGHFQKHLEKLKDSTAALVRLKVLQLQRRGRCSALYGSTDDEGSTEGGAILVFCRTHAMTMDIHAHLSANMVQRRTRADEDVSVMFYHGGMSGEDRDEAQMKWVSAARNKDKGVCSVRIMCCTSAFGTGVDIGDVRAVFHVGVCPSLAQYAQEAGRAGRDGRRAECTWIMCREECATYNRLLSSRVEMDPEQDSLHEHENKVLRWKEAWTWATDRTRCRKNALYSCLDVRGPGLCVMDNGSANCDNCEAISATRPGRGVGSVVNGGGVSVNGSGGGGRIAALAAPAVRATREGRLGGNENVEELLNSSLISKVTGGSRSAGTRERSIAAGGAFQSSLQKKQDNVAMRFLFGGASVRGKMRGFRENCRTPQQKVQEQEQNQEQEQEQEQERQRQRQRQRAQEQDEAFPPLRTPASVPSTRMVYTHRSAAAHPLVPAETAEMIREFRSMLGRLARICIPCLVTTGQEIRAVHHSAHEDGEVVGHRPCNGNSRGRCLRCYSLDHRVGNCPFRRGALTGTSGTCWTCWMGHCNGVRLHEAGEYGKKSCPLQAATDLAWMIWRHEPSREAALSEEGLFSADEANSVILAAGGKDLDFKADKWFYNWMTADGDGVPRVMAICRWWYQQRSN